uniref:Uncharacterized protein n=1 Tax=viral metagenome TaxID=1070528 RepID=A0A6M3ID84_9ZZZZ
MMGGAMRKIGKGNPVLMNATIDDNRTPGEPALGVQTQIIGKTEMEKIKFKILRDKDNRPTVTICEIRVNGHIGTGIAIRSLKDNPVEKLGKAKAWGRAKKALYRLSSSMPVCRKEAHESLSAVHPLGWPIYKSEYKEIKQ